MTPLAPVARARPMLPSASGWQPARKACRSASPLPLRSPSGSNRWRLDGSLNELMEARDERRLLRVHKQMASVKLLIIDEPGFVPLSKTGAELLFEMISQRYERGATLITSNLPFDEWPFARSFGPMAVTGSPFGTERLTGALLDRLTHHVNILEMSGESYRLAHTAAPEKPTPTPDHPVQIWPGGPKRHGTRQLCGERARHGAQSRATGLVLRRPVEGYCSAVDMPKHYRPLIS